VELMFVAKDPESHPTGSPTLYRTDRESWVVQGPTAAIKVTRPQEIAQYAALFEHLQNEAIYGKDARQLITDVRDSL